LICDDPAAPPMVRSCARLWLVAGLDPVRYRLARDGTKVEALIDPEVGRAWERIADRLDGRPTQTVHVHRTQERSPIEIASAMSALLARHPELARMLPAGVNQAGGGAPQRDAVSGGDAPPIFQPSGESCPGPHGESHMDAYIDPDPDTDTDPVMVPIAAATSPPPRRRVVNTVRSRIDASAF
jgi:hypothetical protein